MCWITVLSLVFPGLTFAVKLCVGDFKVDDIVNSLFQAFVAYIKWDFSINSGLIYSFLDVFLHFLLSFAEFRSFFL